MVIDQAATGNLRSLVWVAGVARSGWHQLPVKLVLPALARSPIDAWRRNIWQRQTPHFGGGAAANVRDDRLRHTWLAGKTSGHRGMEVSVGPNQPVQPHHPVELLKGESLGGRGS